MKISSRFSIAVHTMLVIQILGKENKTTSEFIASSVNVNPVIIRRTLQDLKKAGLVNVVAGTGGAALARKPKEITLYDIYAAVECVDGDLFSFHDNPNPECPVGKNIHNLLDVHLADAQLALENSLKGVTLKSLIKDYKEIN
ncbi:MAG: Rrf2 family transcriptional regulator [Clostridia bacterium]|nr:Rrf2 family transcriptional regulator [Clostridia bacterium]